MSTSSAGWLSRMLSVAIRLWPPAKSRASSCASRSIACATERALASANGAGFIILPAALLRIVAAAGGPSILAVARAVGEARVAEPGADGEHAPMGHVAHERRLAQPLHHRVVVQEDGGIVLADGRD